MSVSCIRLLQGIHLPSVVRLRPKRLIVLIFPILEDLEEASGRGDREDWFEEGGCPETRQVEGPSASNCRRIGVNPAITVKGTTADKN